MTAPVQNIDAKFCTFRASKASCGRRGLRLRCGWRPADGFRSDGHWPNPLSGSGQQGYRLGLLKPEFTRRVWGVEKAINASLR
jgi:hypothetical protein